MSAPVQHRPLLRKGIAPKARTRSAKGFDYPTSLVGASTWTGSDSKPVAVYVDPASGPEGLAAAKYLLTKIDDVMALV